MDSWKVAVVSAAVAMGTLKVFQNILARFFGETGRGLALDAVRTGIQHSPALRAGLVSHRGWHYPNDDVRRPLENTLPAYERSWVAGVPFCECDVTLTADGEIILCHDDDLKRLALEPSKVVKSINDCAFKGELEFLPLKDGSRVPKLIEVLDAAKRAGPGHKLVIEIKGKDAECGRRVAEVIKTYHEQVALVMSFSLESVAAFAKNNPRRGDVLSLLLTTTKRDTPAQFFDFDQTEGVLEVVKSAALDGLYLQYHPQFLTDDRFISLCKRIPIGIWGRFFLDPDNKEWAELLLQRGARFVNTDFPDRFFSSTLKGDNMLSRPLAYIYDSILRK